MSYDTWRGHPPSRPRDRSPRRDFPSHREQAPRGPPPAYQFGHHQRPTRDDWPDQRRGDRYADSRRPMLGRYVPEEDFSFRREAPPSLHSRMPLIDGPRGEIRDRQPRDRQGRNDGRPFQHRDNRSRPFNRAGAHERPILGAIARGSTPEQLSGMNDDEIPATRFMKFEDVSDSSEADMEIEFDGEDKTNIEMPPTPRKSESIPQWSNPEIFTALPPPDESRVKKKDVVKLIKKARLSTGQAKQLDKGNANDDFIPLDAEVAELQPVVSQEIKVVIPTAPFAPKYEETGNRATSKKRKLLDLENLSPPPLPKKGRQAPSGGHILPEWAAPKNGRSATPWCANDHSVTANMGFWLHKEIRDFYDFVKPQALEEKIRTDLVGRVERAIAAVKQYEGCSVHTFGSSASGIFLPDADLDLVLLSSSYRNLGPAVFGLKSRFYWQLSAVLERAGLVAAGSLNVIAKARVPIIKFVDNLTGIKVDLSVENTTGITANATFQRWRQDYPAMPILVTMIKQFLAMRGLNDVSSGGLGGFSVTCLVTSLLQLMPQVQSGNLVPEHHLGEMLLEFLDLYGNRMEFGRVGICLDPPGYFDKSSSQLKLKGNAIQRLTIQDPNDVTNDIAGGTRNILSILDQFSVAFKTLQDKLSSLDRADLKTRKGQSLLGPILGGNYSSFDWHRARLQKINGGE